MKRIKKKLDKPVKHEQWIEIKVHNGKTVTTHYPPNEEFEKLRLEMDPPPELIYRRLNFINGVPPDYAWTQPSPRARLYGGHFVQRMKPDDWLWVLNQERSVRHSTVVPCRDHQPRPAAYGPCPCAPCTLQRDQEDKRLQAERDRQFGLSDQTD